MESIPNYNFLEILGSGSYGKVFKAENNKGEQFAIKSIDYSNSKLIPYIDREIKILESILDDNIIRLFEVYKQNNKIYLVTEFCKGGDLENYLENNTRVPETIIKKWTKALLSSLASLESKNIMHRDIKLSNLYLTDSDIQRASIKIGDFGFARFLNNNLACSHVGTPLYMAPEIFNHKNYHFKADVWSLGLVIYELIAGVPLFECFTMDELLLKQREKIEFPESFSEEAKEIISLMLQYDEKNRPGFEDLLNLKFVENFHDEAYTPSIVEIENFERNIILEAPNGYFVNILELDRSISIVKRILLIASNLDKHSFCDLISLILDYSSDYINEIFEKFSSFGLYLSSNNRINELKSRMDEIKNMKNFLAEECKLADGPIVLQESVKAAAINKLIQLLFEYDDEDKFLLISFGRSVDPCNILLIESYNFIEGLL